MPLRRMADKETAPKIAPPPRLPRKTAWAVAWFAILGIGVLSWRGELPFVQQPISGGDGTAEAAPSPPGPLPGAVPSELEEMEPAPERARKHSAADGASRLPHQPIDDGGGATMCRFYRALDDLERGGERRRVRVLHYGDSILTTDELSGRARRVLQRRFGDAGHGFVLLGKPWRWYHHIDSRTSADGGQALIIRPDDHDGTPDLARRPRSQDVLDDGRTAPRKQQFGTAHPNATAGSRHDGKASDCAHSVPLPRN